MWKRMLGVLPGVGVAFLPKLACPMCWPAYAGLLSSLGLGFLISSRCLLVVTSVFRLIAVAALGIRAKARRGYGPMLLGAAAEAVIVFGKFHLESVPAVVVNGKLAGCCASQAPQETILRAEGIGVRL